MLNIKKIKCIFPKIMKSISNFKLFTVSKVWYKYDTVAKSLDIACNVLS